MIKGKKGWLITWEGDEFESFNRPKVVAILPPLLQDSRVIQALSVLYQSEYPFTLCEKLGLGTANRKNKPVFLNVAYRIVNHEYYYGRFPHAYLRARQVKNLRCENGKSLHDCTLHWTELPKYIVASESSIESKMVLGEKDASYTYSTKHH